MKLTERLQEAFDKRVCGTAMLPASDLLSAMTAIEQAEAENATLKEQVAQLTEDMKYVTNAKLIEAKCVIAQQATVIEQMRDALHLAANNMKYVGAKNWDIIANALLLQPSPEILQTRDERVAEACKAACENERIGEIIGDSDQAYENAITHCSQAIDSKEWRKYL